MMNLFSIKDIVSDSWQPPVTALHSEEAKRSFILTCVQPSLHEMYLRDIHLYHVGTFDETTGLVQPCKPKLVCRGDDPVIMNYRSTNFGGESNEMATEEKGD